MHKYIPNTISKQWKMRKELTQLINGYDIVHIHRSDLRWIMSYCAWKAGCKVSIRHIMYFVRLVQLSITLYATLDCIPSFSLYIPDYQ